MLANVVALNFCYDVPVKLYSSNLLLMAAFLAAPEAPRLCRVLVLNRPAPASQLPAPQFTRRWARIAVTAFWVLFVGYTLFGDIYGGWRQYKRVYAKPDPSTIFGTYQVESFSLDGHELPPLTTDPVRWRRADFGPQSLMVRRMDDSLQGFRATYSQGDRSIALNLGALTWSSPDPQHLKLEGTLNGSPLSIALLKMDPFPLTSHGFHWINELPYNR